MSDRADLPDLLYSDPERALADRLGAHWKQTVFVENRGGAAGNLAADAVAKAQGDGYTLLFAQNGLAISAAALPNLPFKAETDLVPLAPVAATPHILIVAPEFPAKDVEQLKHDISRPEQFVVNFDYLVRRAKRREKAAG